MSTKIGVNGFGRTGRLAVRAINQYYSGKLEVVAVNDNAPSKTLAHLYKYDSCYGIYPGEVRAEEDSIIIDGKVVKVSAKREPGEINWGEHGVEMVIESTGHFTDAGKAAAHLQGGVKKVIISAPARGEDVTVVLGVNEEQYDRARHRIISNASCTTNCFAPIVKVLHQSFGINKGLLTTIHAYTADQRLVDGLHHDLRRARAAAMSMVPTTTGAARAVTQVIPELKGKLHGVAIRVPVLTVSACDFVADLAREVTVDEVNRAFQAAAEGKLKRIIEYCGEPLVSIDFKGNPASAIFDALSTMVIEGNMVKVLAWYDNEWGYSCRLADLAAYIVDKGL